LEEQFNAAKKELESIEDTFPKEIMELKQRIAEAKSTTKEFEEKTHKLAEELKLLKA
jgi:hypothetical protein